MSEGILKSHCSATRGLLATDHVILDHGQVTRTTPELTLPSPNYHTTPTGGCLWDTKTKKEKNPQNTEAMHVTSFRPNPLSYRGLCIYQREG
ncbi:hypothetical protein TNCV_2864631 [Trichonephila clavipes]|nr:hypothetical protein TNCV_2864631 [Trichonephila clavipes]